MLIHTRYEWLKMKKKNDLVSSCTFFDKQPRTPRLPCNAKYCIFFFRSNYVRCYFVVFDSPCKPSAWYALLFVSQTVGGRSQVTVCILWKRRKNHFSPHFTWISNVRSPVKMRTAQLGLPSIWLPARMSSYIWRTASIEHENSLIWKNHGDQ